MTGNRACATVRAREERGSRLRILAHLVANGLALVILARLIPDDLNYDTTETVVIFAIVLAILNFLIRPVLHLIAFPLTCLTLGLFSIVINAVVFYAAARLVEGIEITALGALVGTVTVSLLTGILSSVFKEDRFR